MESLEKLKSDLLAELKKANVELAPNVGVDIYNDRIHLYPVDENGESIFGSVITITATQFDSLLKTIRKPKISFGTTGSFNPESIGDYWRSIHAASILKNWDVVVEIVNLFCNEYLIILDSVS